jgi:hypothetical protein
MAGARPPSEEKTYGEGSTFCQRINTLSGRCEIPLKEKWELDPRVMEMCCGGPRSARHSASD